MEVEKDDYRYRFMDLELLLQKIGLTQRQAKIYLACLRLGPIGLTDLSRETQEKKTTVFDTAKSLIEKNFLSKTKKDNRNVFVAEKPETIENVFRNNLDIFTQSIDALNSLTVRQDGQPLVKYYQGRNGLKQIFEDILSCQEKVTYYWGAVKTAEEVLGPRYLRQWVKRKAKKGIHDKGLRTKKEELKDKLFLDQKKYLREIRYTPTEILVGASLSIYDHRVAFITSTQENFGFVVESLEFSQMMKNVFNLVWSLSQPLLD